MIHDYYDILLSLTSLNLIFMPFITYGAVRKLRRVRNPEKNDSYSIISIWILKMVIS